MTTYPDTLLRDDQADPLYGGQAKTDFGGMAWEWVNNVLRFLGVVHLQYNRVPYRTAAFVVTGAAVAAGDVLVADLTASGVAGVYVVRRAAPGDAGAASSVVVGVAVEGAAAGRIVAAALSGILPRTLSGFAALTAAQPVAVDYTAGRLKVAGGGDPVVGYGDPNGNVALAF